jgi:site-specific DNA-methyltransferase (cytosine-N4-specific)
LGDDYLAWLETLAPRLSALLAPDGSIVVEVGNAWEEGKPLMSTMPLETLLAFKRAAKLNLCQQVICHNPARLPSPAQWVTVKRIRLKDSYTHVWWMSPSENPKADNKRVLTPYSDEMKKLFKRKRYNAGRRPSGHVVSEKGFLTDHGGAIPANVIDIDPEGANLPSALQKFAGTSWDVNYRNYCTEHGYELHPARMQMELAAFFIQFLTDPDDLVVDPFAGSNTTGAAAEVLGRRWLAVEADPSYAEGSKGRFPQLR